MESRKYLAYFTKQLASVAILKVTNTPEVITSLHSQLALQAKACAPHEIVILPLYKPPESCNTPSWLHAIQTSNTRLAIGPTGNSFAANSQLSLQKNEVGQQPHFVLHHTGSRTNGVRGSQCWSRAKLGLAVWLSRPAAPGTQE